MLQLKNTTPFAANFGQLCGYDSQEYTCVTAGVSLTYDQGQWHLADEQLEPPHHDRYQFDDPASPLLLPNQLSFNKGQTDFIFDACATSRSAPVTELPVSVSILSAGVVRSIELDVVGDQHIDAQGISRRNPFNSMPLGFERAYGGGYQLGGGLHTNEIHPEGRGYLPDQKHIQLLEHGVWLPNCYAKGESSLHYSHIKACVALGPMPVTHQARRQYAGTFDKSWQEARAPYLPDDFHPLFFQAGLEALRWDGMLSSDFQLQLTNLGGLDDCVCPVPKLLLDVEFRQGRITGQVMDLHTVFIQPGLNTVHLIFGHSFLMPPSVSDLRLITVRRGY